MTQKGFAGRRRGRAAKWNSAVARGVALATLMLFGQGCGGRADGGEAPTQPERVPQRVGDGPPRLLVLSSLIGYIEPCGCTVDLLLGGIDRTAAAVARERALGPTAVLVIGPTFFGGPVPDHLVGQEEAKARLLARTLAAIGVDAVALGAEDLVRGRPLLDALVATLGAPDVSVNVPGGAPRVLDVGPIKVGVFAVHAPAQESPGGRTTDPAAAATAAVETLRAAGAHVVVGIGDMPRRALRRLAGATSGVDLWFLARAPSETLIAAPVGDSHLLEAGDRGRHVGRLVLNDAHLSGPLADPFGEAQRARTALESRLEMQRAMLTRHPDPQRALDVAGLERALAELPGPDPVGKHFEYDLLPVAKALEPDLDIAAQVAAYNAELARINLALAGEIPPVPDGQSGYLGGAECIDCHPEAHDVWLNTRHARAWATLVEANKTFDAECVGCHVAGWQRPGGAVLGQTERLQNVQCEACHGPGAKHAESGGEIAWIVRDPPAEVCAGCHNAHHSPRFDFAAYRPKTLGPGHGLPAPPGR